MHIVELATWWAVGPHWLRLIPWALLLVAAAGCAHLFRWTWRKYRQQQAEERAGAAWEQAIDRKFGKRGGQ